LQDFAGREMDPRRNSPDRAQDVFGRGVYGQEEDDRFCARFPRAKVTPRLTVKVDRTAAREFTRLGVDLTRMEGNMMQRYVLMASAWLEIFVGAIFITVPDVPCGLLFGARPEGIGMPLARWVGVALLALGIACLNAEESHHCVGLGLFVFNAGLALLLVWVGLATTFHGFLLWPGAALHAAITVALLPQLRASKGGSA